MPANLPQAIVPAVQPHASSSPPRPTDMAALPRRTGLACSSSPFSGTFSIFADSMVEPSHTSQVSLHSLEMPEDSYTLSDLCNCEGKDEEATGKWVESIVKNMRGVSVVVTKGLPEMPFHPFHANYLLIPDVTVTKFDLAILTLEVVSGDDYKKTVSKAVVNSLEMLRIWRTFNTQVDECTCFVVPNTNGSRPSSVMEVTVTFQPFSFRFALSFVSRDQVCLKIKNKITRWHFTKKDRNPLPFFVRLSEEECNLIERGATQVLSSSSLIVKSNTAFWKFNRQASRTYRELAGEAKHLARQKQKLFQFTLLPVSIEKHGDCAFDKLEPLQPPLSRENAKQCLLSLLDGLQRALEELHKNDIAHLDVRLPNICFRQEACVTVILIDADRCQLAARGSTSGVFSHYNMSDMYRQGTQYGTWTNRQADMRSVGMMICFILDSQLTPEDYHSMLREKKVDPQLCEEPFIKQLLEKGEWNEELYHGFKETHKTLNHPIFF